jgi:hypothetical protein
MGMAVSPKKIAPHQQKAIHRAHQAIPEAKTAIPE